MGANAPARRHSFCLAIEGFNAALDAQRQVPVPHVLFVWAIVRE